MCFSVSSSFTAAFMLLSTGVFALKYFHQKRVILFAAIPLLFGIQQFFEGLVWMTINTPEKLLHLFAANSFLFFAIVIWPIWIPLSLSRYDQGIIKKIIYVFLIIGIAIATFFSYHLLMHPAYAVQVNDSLFYAMSSIDGYISELMGITIYAVPTIAPFFVSKMPFAKISGIAIICSLLLAFHIKHETFGSVWCFFAALLSILVITCLKKSEILEKSIPSR